MGTTGIEWTDATWNPVAGCTAVSPGCTNCYAMRMTARLDAMGQAKYHALTRREERRHVWTGTVRCDEPTLGIPLRWRKSRLVFVNSMSDLFHEEVPDTFIEKVWQTMEAAEWHTFQILTKRPKRMRELSERLQLLPNVWLGTSVENADYLWRLNELRATRAAVRFASFEPLLGPVDNADLEGIDWAVVGGESGPGARLPDVEWVRALRDRCQEEGVAFFFKQWGGTRKKEAGRHLDGRTWDDKPARYSGQESERESANDQGSRVMRSSLQFRWRPGEPPPRIEEHSKAKLKVLRQYLRAYLSRLSQGPFREQFKLDLVDGFSGGGTFTDGEQVLSGTPLIMIEECEEAKERLNRNRKKRLDCDFKYYFTDSEALHIGHLKEVLAERGLADNENVVVQNSRFEDAADAIIAEIKRRQPRAGRAIFLLDQTGFAQVEVDLIAKIFDRLPAAEVILTFAADALINYLSTATNYIKAVSPLKLTKSGIQDLIGLKNGAGGRALAQRVLRGHIREWTKATYDTPFFIQPAHSRRALWFLHLSRHPTARDVMIQQHWDISKTFEHYGSGDFEMLGWDALKSEETLRLFRFEDVEERDLEEQLLKSMPAKLHALTAQEPINVQAMHYELANRTAARFSDLDKTVIKLFREKEFDILNSQGKRRSRSVQRLRPEDWIAATTDVLLPGIRRR